MKRGSLLGVLCVACGGGMDAAGPPLSATDVGRPWIKLGVPCPVPAERVLRTEAGFFTLCTEQLGEYKVWTGSRTSLHSSRDGVAWTSVPISPVPAGRGMRDLAYGEGRFVSAVPDNRSSQIWTSPDARSWSVFEIPVQDANFFRIVHAGDRFFVLGNSTHLATSSDGKDWRHVTLSTLQLNGLAYGNDRYVLVGSGPIQYSDDGLSWNPVQLDCSLPDACITDPSGGVHQHVHEDVVFADGFYVDQLFSSDGEHWQAHSYPSPEIALGGYLLGRPNPRARWGTPLYDGERETVEAWKPGGPIATIQIDAIPTNALGGRTCLNHRCVVLKNTIYMIP